jgi:NADPH:quinone reductase-like Zn-dependent oxidoreductase
MRAFQIRDTFGLDHLLPTDLPSPPPPGPGQVLVAVKAISLNYRDLMMIRGQYNPRQPLPLTPCSDAACEVLAVGPNVTRWKVGQTAATAFAQGWIAGPPHRSRTNKTLGGPLQGVLTEQLLLPEDGLSPYPAHLSPIEAATLPCAALTAWSALVTLGQVTAGQTVLILGTGGVSLFALQIARLLGARVIITSSSDEKLSRALALGASHGINYTTTPAWGRAVRDLTGGEGVDHVVEVGGANTLSQSIQATRPGGTISLIGVLSGAVKDLNITPILMQNIRVQGVLVGHQDSFGAMSSAFALHGTRPVIDQVFPFADTRAAFDHLASGRHFGKICISLTP